MKDGYRGLPIFLANRFVGNSKEQLLKALRHFEILSSDEIQEALDASLRWTNSNNQL